MPSRLLVEARPGAGKTTAFRRLAELLQEDGVSPSGFTTEELRERGRRVGFAIESLDGERATLAHRSLSGPPRVGPYGVDLEAFERIALPSLRRPSGVVLIDELGKMELASESFRAAVERLLDEQVALAATVHVARHPFTDGLKRRPDVEVIRLTAANRDGLPAELARRLGSRGQCRRKYGGGWVTSSGAVASVVSYGQSNLKNVLFGPHLETEAQQLYKGRRAASAAAL